MQTKNLVHDNDSSISKTMAIAFVASALWSASAVASADSTSLTKQSVFNHRSISFIGYTDC